MKELRKKALNFILEHIEDNGKLSSVTHYYDYFDTIKSLVVIGDLDNSRKILLYLSRFQTWEGDFSFEPLLDHDGKHSSVLFLEALSKFLIKSDSKEDLKLFKKVLIKSIKNLRSYFDEDYLLFFSRDLRGFKWFLSYENSCYLDLASEFSDFLNHHDFTKEADELFMLKGKCELGFERYFIQEKILVGRFSNDLELFDPVRSLEELMIYNGYFPYPKLIDNFIKNILKEKTVFDDVTLRLSSLLLFKKQNLEYKKQLKKDLKFLVEIPTSIVSNNFLDTIEKSLFHKDLHIKEIKGKKQRVIVGNRNRLRVASLILRLID
jgi:hypothetical protein